MQSQGISPWIVGRDIRCGSVVGEFTGQLEARRGECLQFQLSGIFSLTSGCSSSRKPSMTALAPNHLPPPTYSLEPKFWILMPGWVTSSGFLFCVQYLSVMLPGDLE